MEHGFAFALDEPWAESSLFRLQNDHRLFHEPKFDLPTLDFGDNESDSLHAAWVEIPPLSQQGDDANPAGLENLDGHALPNRGATSPTATEPSETADDIWSLSLPTGNAQAGPKLRTWEAFEISNVEEASGTACLSEAGPGTYDAALCSDHGGHAVGLLPRDTSLRALCDLALGRSSIFFQWNESKQCFRRTLTGVPTAGTSVRCTDNFTAHIMEYATLFRTLHSYAATRPSRHSLPAVVAAAGNSIASVLAAVEIHVAGSLPQIHTLLQLQNVLERPSQLLQTLDELRGALIGAVNDEAAVSRLSDAVHRLSESGTPFAGVLNAILSVACQPWIASLTRDLSLEHQPSYQSDTDPTDQDTCLEDSMHTSRSTKDRDEGPLSLEDHNLIRATKATVRLLRKHLPDCAMPVNELLRADLAFGPSVRESHEPHVQSAQLAHHPHPTNAVSSWVPAHLSSSTEGAWAFDDDEQRCLELMQMRMSTMPTVEYRNRGNDPVTTTAEGALTVGHGSPDARYSQFKEAASVSPFDLIRPVVEAQARRTNHLLLRHLFQECHLVQHLKLQHDFHLLGNGDFVTRLSTALFSTETQSAKRQRGVVPTAEVMGLRLGVQEGQRWPPASSELRLTLLGVLSEAYLGDTSSSNSRVSIKSELPGGLSFAIREMPDTEIDKVLDASSIYALDFLRLQYAAPPPLDEILTSTSMHRYDEMFRFLLRFVRVLDATKRWKRETITGCQPHPVHARSALACHHVAAAMMSYFMDVGIAAPWNAFQRTVDAVQQSVEVAATVNTGVKALRDIHHDFLETVRDRLFLKRKQEVIRSAIESVLISILKLAGASQAVLEDDKTLSRDYHEAYSEFGAAASRLIELLQGLADKPPRRHGRMDFNDSSQGDMAKLLLAKLNWNSFFDNGQA